MSTTQIGLLYAAATFLFLFSGMPIAFAVGSVALVFMYLFMPAAQLVGSSRKPSIPNSTASRC